MVSHNGVGSLGRVIPCGMRRETAQTIIFDMPSLPTESPGREMPWGGACPLPALVQIQGHAGDSVGNECPLHKEKEMRTMFSPGNQLLFEAKQMSAEIHGMKIWAGFPRWYSDGTAMWIESSSGSMLLFIDFTLRTARVPDWKVEMDGTEKQRDLPKHWDTLYAGSLFNPDGSATYPDDFQFSEDQEGWKGNL